MRNDNAKVSEFLATMQVRFTKCLDPTLTCGNDAIKAHSVQNAAALSLIEEDNHVYELKMRIILGEPVCAFQRVGRNIASTFTGLCGQHDAEIFRPIDPATPFRRARLLWVKPAFRPFAAARTSGFPTGTPPPASGVSGRAQFSGAISLQDLSAFELRVYPRKETLVGTLCLRRGANPARVLLCPSMAAGSTGPASYAMSIPSAFICIIGQVRCCRASSTASLLGR